LKTAATNNKIKVFLSIFILVFAVVSVALIGTGTNREAYHEEGMIIDFGKRDVKWTKVDFSQHDDAISALQYVCSENGYSYTLEGESKDLEYQEDLILPFGYGMAKDGFRLVGWALNSGGPMMYEPGAIIKMPSLDITLYAVWVQYGSYIVSYNSNGGEGSVNDLIGLGSVTLSSGTGLSKPGHELKGWSTIPDGSKEFELGAAHDLNVDTILYAVWNFTTNYTLIYDAQGGTGSISSINSLGKITLSNGHELTKTNNVLVGWSDVPSGLKKFDLSGVFSLTENTTLYAIWVQSNTNTLTYNANGGTGPIEVSKGTNVQLSDGANIYKEGCTLMGWSSTPGGSKEFDLGADFELTSDMTLYAIWSVNEYSVSYVSGGNGPVEAIVSLEGYQSYISGKKWALWVVKKGNTNWTKVLNEPSSINPSEYSAIAWAYTDDKILPNVGVDYTGVCFYGYSEPMRIVTLAPSVTETVCAVGKEQRIVGTDLYSNYPESIVQAREAGKISETGGYTNPSYEAILKLSPDMVVCEGAQASHIKMAEKLRSAGINVVVLIGGVSVETVLSNIFVAGYAVGADDEAKDVPDDLENAMNTIATKLGSAGAIDVRVMVSLSSAKSPWVSGSGTYMADVMSMTFGSNIYAEENGWTSVNSETIMERNPQVIIIVEGSNADIGALSSEWKSTLAYPDNIYMLSGKASDIASRPGPRIAQTMELVGRMLHNSLFGDSIVIPNYIGDNYSDYLSYTKNMGYG